MGDCVPVQYELQQNAPRRRHCGIHSAAIQFGLQCWVTADARPEFIHASPIHEAFELIWGKIVLVMGEPLIINGHRLAPLITTQELLYYLNLVHCGIA